MKNGTLKAHPKKQRKKCAFLTPLTLQNEAPVQAGARFSLNQRLQKCIPKTSQNASQNRWNIIKMRVKMRYKKYIEKSSKKVPKSDPRGSPNPPQILPKSSQNTPKVLSKPTLAPKEAPREPQDLQNTQKSKIFDTLLMICSSFFVTFSMKYSATMSKKNGPRHHTLHLPLTLPNSHTCNRSH